MVDILLNQKLIFGLMGGLGLFLFGMKIMSEGLQKVAGDRMRKILGALTANRVVGTLVGLAVTAIIQSSSATTVMVVGFVNAGLMSLVQSIGVILGANVGTTVTAQLIAFKITKFALPAIGIGAGLKLFGRDRKWVYTGEIILGFGILFFGLSTMKHAFDPVKTSEEFRQIFTMVGDNHLIAVLIGALLTVIVQSSSATIGITLALATSGLLSFDASVALILGENIGTTITANLAAIGTNLAARRTAFAHFLFNALGVSYMLLLFPFFMDFISSITPGDADLVIQTQAQAEALGGSIGDKPFIARHIANTHTLFNIVNVIIFLPLVGLLAKLSTALIRGKDEEMEFHLKFIDNRVLNTPPIALGQARAETKRMGQLALEVFDESLLYLEKPDEKRIAVLEKKEEAIDLLQKEITDFLVALSQKSISKEASKEIASLMHMVNDLERVGDHCENLWSLGQRKRNQKIVFSDIAVGEIGEIAEQTRKFLAFVLSGLERGDKTILEKAHHMEDTVDSMEETLRNNHISRLNTGECAVLPGLIFIDMLHNFEKIGDHVYNVAQAVVGDK
ncbi:MAG: Na/Pi cotransporter [Desulfuromonas sp.]|uniref:Na/Pi cotransporter family protein n=2 Tax=Desulfuromonas TaxID=890 RepID=UPI000CC9F628|nr:Na/Pi cotransporter family protein [uncultured Desulfuromonas sp.]PLX86130.1 MAG: Na/Pi cotransporter [Desulfuromonas sp.]